jgi:hypothetical protein
MTRDKLLVRCRRLARAYYNRLRQEAYYRYAHCSHAACEALRLAEKKLGASELGTFGVEGFATGLSSGISFLNCGETYDLTIFFDSKKERFFIACLGDVSEAFSQEG